MRARLIIVIHIRLQHMTKMTLAEHNNMVEAVPVANPIRLAVDRESDDAVV